MIGHSSGIRERVRLLDNMLTRNERPETIRMEMSKLKQHLHDVGVTLKDIESFENEIYSDTAHAHPRRP